MIKWGITALSHDASVVVLENDSILYASESERHSKIKNDPYLNDKIILEALSYGDPEEIVWYEKPWLKKSRQLYSMQWKELFSITPYQYLKKWNLHKKLNYSQHHRSHAAGGYFTSNYNNAVILVIDAIGEWNTISIWEGYLDNLKLVKSFNYPYSLGLLYSSFTQRVGLKPNEEEYIMMGMAAYGKPIYVEKIRNEILPYNLHKGIGNWESTADNFDLAASVQIIIEEEIVKLVEECKTINSNNLVYSGGVALNCVANSKLFDYYKNVWIMPNPGDSGNSVGAICDKKIKWNGPYLSS